MRLLVRPFLRTSSLDIVVEMALIRKALKGPDLQGIL